MTTIIDNKEGCECVIKCEYGMKESSNVQLASRVKDFFGPNQPLYIVGSHSGEIYTVIPHMKYQVKRLEVCKKRKLVLSACSIRGNGSGSVGHSNQLVLAYCTETTSPTSGIHAYHLYVQHYNWNEDNKQFSCCAKYKKIERTTTAVVHLVNSQYIGLNVVLSFTDNSLVFYSQQHIECYSDNNTSKKGSSAVRFSKTSSEHKNIFSSFRSRDIIISIDSFDSPNISEHTGGCYIFCVTLSNRIYAFSMANLNKSHSDDDTDNECVAADLQWTLKTKLYDSIYRLVCCDKDRIVFYGIYDCFLVQSCSVEQFFTSQNFSAPRVPFIDEQDQVISVSMTGNYLFVGTYNGSLAIYHVCPNQHTHILAKVQIQQNIVAIWGSYEEDQHDTDKFAPQTFTVCIVTNSRIVGFQICLKDTVFDIT